MQIETHNQNHQLTHFQCNNIQQNDISFKCYLRTPDMKCKIETINSNKSVNQLKELINKLFQLNISEPQSLKLIINQTQLRSHHKLLNLLHPSVIIHIIPPNSLSQIQAINNDFTLSIKQPPIDSPIFKLQKINPYLSIKHLKQRILSFYKIHHQFNGLAKVLVSQIYLVFAGAIMRDDNVLYDYNVDSNAVLYVINANLYVKDYTKQQAQQRIKQLRQQKKQSTSNKQYQQKELSESNKKQRKNQVIDIIQNIVHDSDSQIQGEPITNLTRSQKIIHRYNSISQDNNIEFINEIRAIEQMVQKANDQNDYTVQKANEQVQYIQKQQTETISLLQENLTPYQTAQPTNESLSNQAQEINLLD